MRILLILITLFIFNSNAYSINQNKFFKNRVLDINKKAGAIISERFSVSPSVSINLGGTNFQVSETDGWHVNAIQHKFSLVFNINNDKELVSAVEIGELKGFRKWTGYLMPWIESQIFKPDDNIDGCVERPYYHTFKRLKKGLFFNCFTVKHLDVQRRLYGEEKKPAGRLIRKAVRDGKVKIPNILLTSEHLYFAMSKKDQLIFVNYYYNPKYFDNYNPIHQSRDESEFHKNNISKFPEAKKTMEKFIKQATFFHQDLESQMKADSTRRIFSPIKKVNYKINLNNNDISEEIIKLNDLYKSGVLTKEEFEKAKKRVLER